MAEQKPLSQTERTNKPSLVSPDFTGLWDTVWIGRENDFTSYLRGMLSQLFFVSAWVFGGTFPVWIILLVYCQWYFILLILIMLMSYSFIFHVQPWPWACRELILAGAHWYVGGASLSYEMPPKGYEQTHSNDPLTHQPSLETMHPHGVFTQGSVYNAGIRECAVRNECTKVKLRRYYLGKRGTLFKDIWGPPNSIKKCLVADAVQYLPIFRHVLIKWTGNACVPANKQNMNRLMTDGISLGLLPGGFYEASFLEYGREQIYIKNVKGFIKYCLQYGYRVIPSYTFGETRTFRNLMNINGSVKKWMSARKLPAVIPVGCWWCPILPINRGGIHTIKSYGKSFPKIEHPTQKDIDYWHDWYISEIKGIFDRNKWRFGMDDEELHIY